ncbi:MAG: VanZ family protein [Eubacteriales bacterium]|nr:VanZ family protein [Eubacteriales bacterium]
MKKGKYILLILLLFWMGVIFAFSAKNNEDSSRESHRISMWIAEIINPHFEDFSMEEKAEFIEKMEFPVRKGAHATEYAILGGLALFTLLAWSDGDPLKKILYHKNNMGQILLKRVIFISWFFTIVYACSDELHQLFVPGRAGMIRDVCIDSLGALLGIGGAIFFIGLWSKIKGELYASISFR